MILQMKGLCFAYSGHPSVLSGIDLEIKTGSFTAILGPNGAGKTTLIKQIAALLKPESGSVLIDECDIRKKGPADLAGQVGMVFQNPEHQLFATTVTAEISFGLGCLGFDPSETKARVTAVLEETGLVSVAQIHPHDLSLSMQKRVALAAVLAMDPDIYLLDEPTQGQDHFGLTLLEDVLCRLKSKGKTVVAVTHDIDFAAACFDQAIVMADGRVRMHVPMGNFSETAVRNPASGYPAPAIAALAHALNAPSPILNQNDFFDYIATTRR